MKEMMRESVQIAKRAEPTRNRERLSITLSIASLPAVDVREDGPI